MANARVVIVGGGVAGLVCARTLHEEGVSFHLLESADVVGGRVRTDTLNGFLLDRGFQVLLDSYSECQRQLDFEKLELRSFESGALIRYQGRFVEFSDPWRKPSAALKTLFANNASLVDKIKLLFLRKDVRRPRGLKPSTTEQYLYGRGLSQRIVESFFRPFFGGVFLEKQLSTNSGKFEYLFDKFSTGQAVVPRKGMGQIPLQLAQCLPQESIGLSSPVKSVAPNQVMLENGTAIDAEAVVIATDDRTAAQLLGDPLPTKAHSVYCVYFAAPKSEARRPILVLNGDSDGPINHLCWLSAAADEYASKGHDLLSVSVLSADVQSVEDLSRQCKEQLTAWYGAEAAQWEHLKTYEIKYALPVQDSRFKPGTLPLRHPSGTFRCGDYIEFASLNGAMKSGRECAEAVLESLKLSAAA